MSDVLLDEPAQVVDRRDRLAERLGAEEQRDQVGVALDVELADAGSELGLGLVEDALRVGEMLSLQLGDALCRPGFGAQERETRLHLSELGLEPVELECGAAFLRLEALALGTQLRGLPIRPRRLDGLRPRRPEQGDRRHDAADGEAEETRVPSSCRTHDPAPYQPA